MRHPSLVLTISAAVFILCVTREPLSDRFERDTNLP